MYMHAKLLQSLFATVWTVAHLAPLSMGFSRQIYWSGCHSLLQGIFLTQGSNPEYLALLMGNLVTRNVFLLLSRCRPPPAFNQRVIFSCL